MKKTFIFSLVLAVLVIIIFAAQSNRNKSEAPNPTGDKSNVSQFDLKGFTDPTVKFIAELANLLIEKTR